MRWDYEDGWGSSHPEIVGYDDWRNIENYTTFQGRAGVYIFSDRNLQVKYVGKAGAGRMIAEIYNAISRGKGWGGNSR